MQTSIYFESVWHNVMPNQVTHKLCIFITFVFNPLDTFSFTPANECIFFCDQEWSDDVATLILDQLGLTMKCAKNPCFTNIIKMMTHYHWSKYSELIKPFVSNVSEVFFRRFALELLSAHFTNRKWDAPCCTEI